ncbi:MULTISPECIES: 3D-(3,5/4)-trihydroxycyclohexane-1,2-dione acylhydrolase (decyclizing) [unclassified Oceanispirochaeta]|uniref:3D-(3,5/4)-trihydroxycyclohexane-1,2-dione acylhydrolase (decyclizing) n=1 Tax=unclassified Oceanispirochaeta TaxID=2635722 RepID=UPI000E091491|nr:MULTISPECIES: 3D-(3,5/4)-trihydroxycyclohexane-1,2-dione acylhydrolase (decyclizing) [unclassified Oceanispirochaeta]MBF9016715.1 3D-(3,5/4)-trihydroxycyclohexane-1,2-dione acylhydrolase (decyclizing) [Oceanispirochaeta sp. M2]NPD73080.1 3D-(3,5/4)-trihydroxycyclohexane-1,2-dione acylhydrolase (decyclizing) [Oceanispirochaeta sp. M1]RDG31184.1 3D-(3,5/4)-trihydroxycyclohexane-1,2-dione acylhydrolase (decyclizing) [Oceanispirochaeta sp. M1]
MKTVRMTMGQALVKFLDNQYISFDGEEEKFVNGVFGIFGHGCVVGIGEALQEPDHSLKFYQGHNEQGMAHAAIAYAKQNNRRKIMAVTSSIGPGALNMVTAAGLASVNRIPVLLLPGDSFACRQPDPVLQQMEQFNDSTVTSNDAFRSVCRYWDRVSRPEQLMSAAMNAMRVLTDPADTGAVCLALPQDVQAEAWDYPVEFFEKRVHFIERRSLSDDAVKRAASVITESSKPLVVCGGGVRYSEAGEALASFCEKFNIPFGETQAGKSAVTWDNPMNLGGLGVTGGLAANVIAAETDLVIAVGTRLSDFTTASKSSFKRDNVKVLSLNVNSFDAYKMNAFPFLCDAKAGLDSLSAELEKKGWKSSYSSEIEDARAAWKKEVDHLYSDNELGPNGIYSQLRALGIMNEEIFDKDAIIVGASGSLPGDLQRVWRSRHKDTYHMEYGFSCMGYEVSGAVGAKIAAPDQEVYSMTGDASFVMLHSELLTSIQEGVKINIMLFDNNGFGCIDNLQTSQGIPKFGCELKYRNPETGRLDEGGKPIPVDYAKIAEGYGCRVWRVHNSEELRTALAEAKESPVTTLLDIKVDFDSMSEGYESWWRVGTPEVSKKEAVLKANKELVKNIAEAKQY